jgi:hypothetical protein
VVFFPGTSLIQQLAFFGGRGALFCAERRDANGIRHQNWKLNLSDGISVDGGAGGNLKGIRLQFRFWAVNFK